MTVPPEPSITAADRTDRDAFLASLGHDLRGPLASILGLAEALRMHVYGALQGRQDEIIALIETSGERMLEAVNHIVDIANADIGALELEREVVPVSELVAAATQRIGGATDDRRTCIDLRTQAGARVWVDLRRSIAILAALISNAAVFTGRGGEVRVTTEHVEPGQICFRVTNAAPGVDPHELQRLTTRFDHRQSDLARHYPQLGLTMAWCGQIAALQGGEVVVEDTRQGQGNRVAFLAPAAIPRP